MRYLRNLAASLFLGFLFFIAFLPSDVHAESCALNGTSVLNVGDPITVFATDFALNQTLTYRVEIVNQSTAQRTIIGGDFIPILTFFPLNYVIPSVPDGRYTLVLVRDVPAGEWQCANGIITIGFVSPPPPPPAINVLNVNSNIPGGVFITGSQPGTSGTTPYPITMSTDIITTLTPPPVSGWTFQSWSGCTTSVNQCLARVTGGANYTVTANYAAVAVTNTLNVNSNIPGGVFITGSQPGTSGTTPYPITMSTDIITTLTPPPVSGWTFQSWSGCTTSVNQCLARVTGGATYTVTANYSAAVPPPAATCSVDSNQKLCVDNTGVHRDFCSGNSIQIYYCTNNNTTCAITPFDCSPLGRVCEPGGNSCTLPAAQPPPPPQPPPGSSCSFIDPSNPAQIKDIVCVIQRIIEILAPAAAIAFFIMILMGAFRFIKSAGDPKKVANARDTLKYAIFGVILVVAAWLILLLIHEVTKAPVTTVNIP